MDKYITASIYNYHHKHKTFQHFITALGIIPYIIIINPLTMLTLFVITILQKDYRMMSLYFMPYLLSYVIVSPIKNITKRLRPACDRTVPVKQIIDPVFSAPLCKSEQRYLSFPSGHTTLITAILSAFIFNMNSSDNEKYTKTTKIVLTAISCLIILFTALQRMSYGYHFLSDTVIGFLIGIVIGYVTYKYLSYK